MGYKVPLVLATVGIFTSQSPERIRGESDYQNLKRKVVQRVQSVKTCHLK